MEVLNAVTTTHFTCSHETSSTLARGSSTQEYSWLKLHIICTVAYLNEDFPFLRSLVPFLSAFWWRDTLLALSSTEKLLASEKYLHHKSYRNLYFPHSISAAHYFTSLVGIVSFIPPYLAIQSLQTDIYSAPIHRKTNMLLSQHSCLINTFRAGLLLILAHYSRNATL